MANKAKHIQRKTKWPQNLSLRNPTKISYRNWKVTSQQLLYCKLELNNLRGFPWRLTHWLNRFNKISYPNVVQCLFVMVFLCVGTEGMELWGVCRGRREHKERYHLSVFHYTALPRLWWAHAAGSVWALPCWTTACRCYSAPGLEAVGESTRPALKGLCSPVPCY